MEHLAIMKKSWGLTGKILDGRKKIESRWYSVKYKPWDSVKEGETIYFKDSGGPVRIKAKISKVLQFSNLTPIKVREILDRYGIDDGIEEEKIPEFFQRFKEKRYCILIFLKDSRKIKPFEINKKGVGSMASWITIPDIAKIKK